MEWFSFRRVNDRTGEEWFVPFPREESDPLLEGSIASDARGSLSEAGNPAYHISFAASPVIRAADRYGTSWLDGPKLTHMGLDPQAISSSVDAIIPMDYELHPPSIGWSTNPEPLGGAGEADHTLTHDPPTIVQYYLQALGDHPEELLERQANAREHSER